jgi:HAD superfamily hydrolase (TIGR01549 family)
MFCRLGLPAFIGGDDEQADRDTAHTGEHVLDESLVAGHVHKTDFTAGWQGQPGEPEIDRESAPLLFLETVRVHPGESMDETRFAMIDMAGGANDVHVSRVVRMGTAPSVQTTAILDIDGTLIDTNYHHALAWFRAFKKFDIVIPIWKIHRGIGMGGDHMIEALCGEDKERELGDQIRDAEKDLYQSLIDEVLPVHGARDFIIELKRRDHPVVLASSAKDLEVKHYLNLLDCHELVDAWTTSADVENTKPDPDLVLAAMDKVEGSDAVMVGDSTFDCEAANRAGIQTVAVLTGGFSEDELLQAGAVSVFESIDELARGLGKTPLE